MKLFLTALFFSIVSAGFSQDIACGQVPMGGVDVHAELKSDLMRSIKKVVPTKEKKKSSNASFKLFVDCKGAIYSCAFQKGNIDEKTQAQCEEIIIKSQWKPALIDEKTVNSVVFISFIFSDEENEMIIQ